MIIVVANNSVFNSETVFVKDERSSSGFEPDPPALRVDALSN